MKYLVTLMIVLFMTSISYGQATYVGSEACKTCHSSTHTAWKATLHNKIHELPTASTITGDFATTTAISMGTSVANATARVRTASGKYYVMLLAPPQSTGPEYEVTYTYGGGWKQRYLVKIDSSYYILPIQWNSKGYKDNSSGKWTNYTPGTWFNADGSLKPINVNVFRAKSWDKNCMGCHVNGYSINKSIAGADTFYVGKWGKDKSPADITVGCESCHGPASLHASTGDTTKIVNPAKLTSNLRKLEVCGQCHNRASSWAGPGKVGTHEFGKDEINNKYFVPGDSLALYMNFATAPNASGGRGTWQDVTVPRQHHQQYHDWQYSKHFTNTGKPMNCFTCHDAHSDNKHQIVSTLTSGGETFNVKSSDNTLCLSCHATSAPFAGIQKAWVKNESANRDSIAKYVKAHTKHNVYNPETGLNNCVSCHMTKTAITANAYDISTHTFMVVSPKKTIDNKSSTTPVKGMLNSCSSCHRDGVDKAATGPTFGVAKDNSLTDWTEATDIQLADTLWKYYTKMFPTSVKYVSTKLPESYVLSQNFPNPFNPSTEISFQLPAKTTVRLVVYDITGKQVKSLISQEMPAGTFKVTWNSKNDYNEYVASGVYLYKLEAGKYSSAKKMLLVR